MNEVLRVGLKAEDWEPEPTELSTGTAQKARPSVAIAVPLSNRSVLTADEQISLRHLEHYLGAYDIFFVAPEGLVFEPHRYQIKWFPQRYFGSAAAHARLLLSKRFYQAFAGYDYLLIYQLDALVFSNELAQWCSLGFDYIAAPWVTRDQAARPSGLSRCGNGGLSLRKVASFLRVMEPPDQRVGAEEAWRMFIAKRPRYQHYLLYPAKYMLRLKRVNRSWWVRFLYYRNEDRFWSDQAKLFFPDFKVAPPEIGLRFAFDDAPRFCFQQNGQELPFGCHGWYKYDRALWDPFLIR